MWITCDEDFQEYLGLKGYTGEVPMLVWNMDTVSAEGNNVNVQLGDQEVALASLLILNATLDGNPPNDSKVTPEALTQILNHYQDSYGFPTLEELILWLAEFAGDNIDSIIRENMLKSGLRLLPDSSKIHADMIFTSWRIADETASSDAIASVLDNFAKIDLSQLDDAAKQAACYYAMCTAALRKDKNETERIYTDFVIPFVYDMGLLDRLDHVRKETNALGINELILGADDE